MRYCITVVIALCSLFSTAQKPVSIGDTVPVKALREIYNRSGSPEGFPAFSDKLIILDFWATWCTACLHGLPKADSLQSQFGDPLKIILVNSRSTGDDLSLVQAFFKKWEGRTGKKRRLLSLTEDTVMDKLFPHLSIPHYAWIYKGKLLAFSSSNALTATNISGILKGNAADFVMKKDQDLQRPVFSSPDLPMDGLLTYSVFVKGWFDGLPSGNRILQKNNKAYGKAFTNTSLFDMYTYLAKSIDPSVCNKQILTENASELDAPDQREQRDEWYRGNAYTFELDLTLENADQLSERMLETLNLYSGYTGRFEKKKMPCLALVRSGQGPLATKGGAMENRPGDGSEHYLFKGKNSVFVNYLNGLRGIKEYVVDETGYDGNIDLVVDEDLSDLDSVNRFLASHGMKLVKTERVIKVFVVRRRPIE